ncbi:hypothetical protein J5N97_002148 [Dioscorea zingiberensis]|uniref:Protein kinase domain-containing protein n=1 Tax=Dioscorea zingiberensis TaxID=325984 RepID=A0A9D5HQ51_9LILI|nr:hypothetical protein J5N97_002148 [Dioscorea zingiberensis]
MPDQQLMAAVLQAAAIFLLLLTISFPGSSAGKPSEKEEAMALLDFKSSLTAGSGLSSWVPDGTPCDPKAEWNGVICLNGIVAVLKLNKMGLAGQFNPSSLRQLSGLRAISLVGNSLSGPFPEALSSLTSLRAIYLQGNRLSGPIPADFFSKMTRLRKLWLSGNQFTGAIPDSISDAKNLIELRLEGNKLSGQIPDFSSLKLLRALNLSQNGLEGEIPASLSRFEASSFSGNPGLCGPQLTNQPCKPHETTSTTSIETAGATNPGSEPKDQEIKKSKLGMIALLLIVVCALGAGAMAVTRARGKVDNFETLGHEQNSSKTLPASQSLPRTTTDRTSVEPPSPAPKRTGSNLQENGGGRAPKGNGSGELVMVNEGKGIIRLSDLMKAAAEVLGNGGLGSAYKAVMASGVAVAVKRMRDMNRVGREGFEAEMRRFGRMNHPNVLPPLAYHYRKDEKLVVSEFVPKGSLLYVLHGDKGADHAALDWPRRLNIILGIARGVGYLHAELVATDIPHGNLKSGNVLLNANFDPLIADYGYITLVNPSVACNTMFAYKSPEAIQHRHVSPKSDVYCLGIIILEILTGKFPSQYLNNTKGGTDLVECAASAISQNQVIELLDPAIISTARSSIPDMQELLVIGLACTESNLDERPDMKEAIKRVEDVGVVATEILKTVPRGEMNMNNAADAAEPHPPPPSSQQEDDVTKHELISIDPVS